VRDLCSFDYAIVRVVPRVDRGEFINAGVVLFCSTKAFLDARIELDRERLIALAPDVDVSLVESHLSVIPTVCRGGAEAGTSASSRSGRDSTGWWRRAARSSRPRRCTRA
jgi:Protein of unknown function (DUF3037)